MRTTREGSWPLDLHQRKRKFLYHLVAGTNDLHLNEERPDSARAGDPRHCRGGTPSQKTEWRVKQSVANRPNIGGCIDNESEPDGLVPLAGRSATTEAASFCPSTRLGLRR